MQLIGREREREELNRLNESNQAEFVGAYDEFLAYFTPIMSLAKKVIVPSKKDRCFREIFKRFQFKELPNTGLGYAAKGSHGNGISGKISRRCVSQS